MRKLFRAITGLIISLILLLIFADIGVYIWLSGNPDKVAEFLTEQTGNEAELGSIRGEFFFGFHVTDLIIYPSGSPFEQKLIRASSVDIDPSYAALLKGKPFPSRISLDDFDLFLTINEEGKLVFPSFSQTATQGGVTTGPLDLPADVSLELSRGSIYLDWHSSVGPPIQGEMREVAGNGELAKNGEIIIAGITGKPVFATNNVILSGRIDPFAKRDIDLNVSGEGINLWEFATLFRPIFAGVPSGSLPTGTAGCEISIKGPLDKFGIGGTLSVSSGKLGNIKLNSGDMKFSYADKVLEISESEVKCYGGVIKLNGELLLDKGPAYRFYIDFGGLDINTYLEEIQLYFQDTVGEFQGHFEGYGEFDNPNSFIAAGNFSSTGGTYLSPFSRSIASLPDRINYDTLQVKFEVASGIIAVNHLLVDGEDLGAVATGTLNLERHLDISGQMRFPRTVAYVVPDLKKWAPFLPKTEEGHLIVNFTLKGDLMDPDFDAKIPQSIFKGFLDGETEIFEGVGDLIGKIF